MNFKKMYFLEEARGVGLGSNMIKTCLGRAREFGFEKCYLETMPYMKAAQKLYEKTVLNILMPHWEIPAIIHALFGC